MYKAFCIFFILIILFGKVNAQRINNKVFQSIRTDSVKDFKDSIQKSLGCGMKLECMYFDIIFYDILLDKENSSLTMKACSYIRANERDTTRLANVQIMLATPVENILSKIKIIGSSSNEKKGKGFPDRMGDFTLNFTFNKNEKLYFVHPVCHVLEFNIDSLLK